MAATLKETVSRVTLPPDTWLTVAKLGMGNTPVEIFATREIFDLRHFGPGTSVVALCGADQAHTFVSDVEMVCAADHACRPRITDWFASLPSRFAASWARPAEPWPDCLPPMFGSAEPEVDASWLDGMAPMWAAR